MPTSAPTLYRTAALVLTVGGLFVLLYFGQAFFIPLAVAALLAMMLSPLDNRLRAWGLPRGLSIAVVTLILVAVVVGVFALLGYQSRRVFEDLDQLEQRASAQVDELQALAEARVGVDLNEDFNVEQYTDRILRSTATYLLATVSSLGTTLLTLVYLILFLLEKERFRRFLVYLAPRGYEREMQQTVTEVSAVSRKYLYGKAIITLILGVLYGLGFWLTDIPFAFMLALIGALLAIVPYIGNIIAAAVAVVVILATGGGGQELLYLAGVMTLAQLLESYILTPVVVGDEVSLNGLTTVVAVVSFGLLWGAPGAILGIPLFGMCKAAFEHITPLRPVAYLMGTRERVNGS